VVKEKKLFRQDFAPWVTGLYKGMGRTCVYSASAMVRFYVRRILRGYVWGEWALLLWVIVYLVFLGLPLQGRVFHVLWGSGARP